MTLIICVDICKFLHGKVVITNFSNHSKYQSINGLFILQAFKLPFPYTKKTFKDFLDTEYSIEGIKKLKTEI